MKESCGAFASFLQLSSFHLVRLRYGHDGVAMHSETSRRSCRCIDVACGVGHKCTRGCVLLEVLLCTELELDLELGEYMLGTTYYVDSAVEKL